MARDIKEQVLDQLRKTTRRHESILIDPLNGCPEDFVESFQIIEDKVARAAHMAGATDDEVFEAAKRGREDAAKDFGGIYELDGRRYCDECGVELEAGEGTESGICNKCYEEMIEEDQRRREL